MAIKNYTTKVPAKQSINEIQDMLVKHGAKGIMFEYEEGTGRIQALKFLLSVKDQGVSFALPVEWRRFQEVLKAQGIKRWDEDDYCYRVAWRNIRDWVDVQMAFFETRIVEIEQIFLPFAISRDGRTLYQAVLNSNLLLDQPSN